VKSDVEDENESGRVKDLDGKESARKEGTGKVRGRHRASVGK
jgi:hypothetical protein